MPFNKREYQIGVKVETARGTPESLVAADYAGNYTDPDHGYAVGEYDRALARGPLSKDAALRGSKQLTLKFTCEAVGGGVATQVPWHNALRACGMKATQAKMITFTTVSGGSFKRGQTVGNNATQGSATKTGVVLAYDSIGATKKLWIRPVTGTFTSGDVVYGYVASTASGTSTASPTNGGYQFQLLSRVDGGADNEAATVQYRHAGHIHTLTDGQGSVTIRAEHDKPLLLDFTFMGCPVMVSGAPDIGALVASVPTIGGAPTLALGYPFLIDGDLSPVVDALNVEIQNQVVYRKAMGANALVGSGFAGTWISDRTVKATTQPEKPAIASKDFAAKLFAGSTMAVDIEVGTGAQTNGMVVVYAPAAQQVGDAKEGDRDMIVTTPLDLMLTGSADDEVWIAHLFG